jgi:signal transduction histidine kinase
VALIQDAIGHEVSDVQTSLEDVRQLKLVFGEGRQDLHYAVFERKARIERLALIENTTAVFAHEIANPLSGLTLSLQVVLADLAQPELDIPNLQETVRAALREVGRLVELLHEFRSVAPAHTLKLKPTDFERMIREILALETRVYRDAGVTVRLDLECGLPVLELDAAKMKQAILNLCKNAAEAMTDGGFLTIKAYRSQGTVVLEVTDDGPGVPDDVDVFGLFETTKPAGSGLGLAVARQIISAHHGSLGWRSDGEGTTFAVRLPVPNADATLVK